MEAEPTDGRRLAEATAGRGRIDALARELAILPSQLLSDIPHILLTADEHRAGRWSNVQRSAATASAVVEILSATADDSLALTPGDDADSLVFARIRTVEMEED